MFFLSPRIFIPYKRVFFPSAREKVPSKRVFILSPRVFRLPAERGFATGSTPNDRFRLFERLQPADFGFAVDDFADLAVGFHSLDEAGVHGIAFLGATGLGENGGEGGSGSLDVQSGQ